MGTLLTYGSIDQAIVVVSDEEGLPAMLSKLSSHEIDFRTAVVFRRLI